MKKILNRTASGIISGLALSILLSGSPAVVKASGNPLEKKVSEKVIPLAPRYNYPDTYCAAYAISVARDYFNKNYLYSDAWNLRYNSGKIQKLLGNEEFERLAEKGLIKKGTIIGTYFSESTHLNDRDEKGEKVQYTHLMVYAGMEEEPVFYHQFIDTIEKIRLSQLKENFLTIKEIINEK